MLTESCATCLNAVAGLTGARSRRLEFWLDQLPYKQDVGGSKPSAPTAACPTCTNRQDRPRKACWFRYPPRLGRPLLHVHLA